MDQSSDNRRAENWRSQLAQLVSGDWRARNEAVEELSQDSDLSLARAVLEIVRNSHSDLNVLSGALQVLQRFGRSITEDLIHLLDETSGELRIYIPLMLGSLEDERAVPALIGIAESENENENARFNAIEALGNLRAEAAAEPLLKILNSDSRYLRYAAALALGEIGWPEASADLIRMVEDPYLAEPAVTALGMIGSVQAVPAILAWTETGTQHDLMTAVSAVVAIGRRDEARVRQILSSRDTGKLRRMLYEMIRAASAYRNSGQIVDQETMKNETDPWWGDAALFTSWLVGDDYNDNAEALEVLTEMLVFPAAVPVVEQTLRVAGRRSSGPLSAALQRMVAQELHISQPDAAYAAARLLANTGGPDAVPLFVDLLSSGDEMLAVMAASGLGKAGIPEAVNVLFNHLGNPSSEVRRAVVNALASREDRMEIALRAIESLTAEEANRREAAVSLLAATGVDGYGDYLFAALSDPAAQVRQAALEALPNTGDERTPDALRRALHDADEGIRASAVRASSNLPSKQALALLGLAAHDDAMWVRRLAASGLGLHCMADGLPSLSYLLRDSQVPVRAAAVQALAVCIRRWGTDQDSGIEEAVALLKQKFSDEKEDEEVRMAAHTAIMQVMAEKKSQYDNNED
jgi:HEAT repeat protein